MEKQFCFWLGKGKKKFKKYETINYFCLKKISIEKCLYGGLKMHKID